MREAQELDAYGHLNWTVGNEDWIACFDAMIVGDQIRYHVVVDCDSGGFIDTIETRDVPIAEAIAQLKDLPDYWADICREHYVNERGRQYHVGVRAVRKCAKAWLAYLTDLVAQGPCREDHECGQCAECCEPGPDPVRDGWIGSDGRL